MTVHRSRRLVGACDPAPPAERTIFHDPERTRFWSAAEASALSPEERKELLPLTIDEERYYDGGVSDPLHYVRALDFLAGAWGSPPSGREDLRLRLRLDRPPPPPREPRPRRDRGRGEARAPRGPRGYRRDSRGRRANPGRSPPDPGEGGPPRDPRRGGFARSRHSCTLHARPARPLTVSAGS
jgi:hypothetical protein